MVPLYPVFKSFWLLMVYFLLVLSIQSSERNCCIQAFQTHPQPQQKQQCTDTFLSTRIFHCDPSTKFTTTTTTTGNAVALHMAKGKNKQAELRQKLEEAKRQNQIQQQQQQNDNDGTSKQQQQEYEMFNQKTIKERNDRLRFEELLQKGTANVLNDYSSDGYLNKQQEEEEIDAVIAGVDRFFEGDIAPTDCFEELVSIKSENAIGSTGKHRLVPWLHKNVARHQDYLIIITEPRQKSTPLYETVKILVQDLPMDVRNRLIIINADSPSENRRWLKKAGYGSDTDNDTIILNPTFTATTAKSSSISSSTSAASTTTNTAVVNVYSDEKRSFMREYTALGTDRFGMTMFILCQGRIRKLARDIDQYGVSRTVLNAVKALQEETRL